MDDVTSGFNIAFEPQLYRWPQFAHAALLELKYVKQNEKVSPEKLAGLKEQAIAQLERYAKDNDVQRAWNLRSHNPSGTVTLHRFVIVFFGADRLLCEEV